MTQVLTPCYDALRFGADSADDFRSARKRKGSRFLSLDRTPDPRLISFREEKDYRIYCGDAETILSGMTARSVHCVVTSPPYYNLRSYLPDDHPSKDKEIGIEQTIAGYLASLLQVFREVHRVLRDDGSLWINLGDTYNAYNGNRGASDSLSARSYEASPSLPPGAGLTVKGLKAKNLLGIPWRVAFMLQDDGWILRQDIIWSKSACMPESVQDRCTRSHEYLFMLTKSERYYYNAAAIREPSQPYRKVGPNSRMDNDRDPTHGTAKQDSVSSGSYVAYNDRMEADPPDGRNKRSVWTLGPEPTNDVHFAVMPTKLVEPCILAGTAPAVCMTCGMPWAPIMEQTEPEGHRLTGQGKWDSADPQAAARRMNESKKTRRAMAYAENGERLDNPFKQARLLGYAPVCVCDPPGDAVPDTALVLDPFAGSGTVGVVAVKHGRRFVGVDLHEEYALLAARRINASLREDDVVKGPKVRLVEGQMGLFDE